VGRGQGSKTAAYTRCSCTGPQGTSTVIIIINILHVGLERGKTRVAATKSHSVVWQPHQPTGRGSYGQLNQPLLQGSCNFNHHQHLTFRKGTSAYGGGGDPSNSHTSASPLNCRSHRLETGIAADGEGVTLTLFNSHRSASRLTCRGHSLAMLTTTSTWPLYLDKGTDASYCRASNSYALPGAAAAAPPGSMPAQQQPTCPGTSVNFTKARLGRVGNRTWSRFNAVAKLPSCTKTIVGRFCVA
jgi:hypothetical protein